ncbi:hypothetical protein BJX70DRAFT_171058 [Aspergillus crustosus]
MNHHYSVPFIALLAWTTLLISADSSVTYCSEDSTGSGAANFSIYQSNGYCEDHCKGSAFAILQEKNCWCSDIAPNEETNVDTSDCDDGCPGFPDDWCGNATEGLYAYIQIGSPSGTATLSSTSSTEESTSTTSQTSTITTSHSTTVTETHGNQVTTITVGDSGATAPADASAEAEGDGGSSLSGGAIAGIVVGVVGGLALIAAAVIFFLAKRRSRANEEQPNKGSAMGYANARGPFSDNHSHTMSNGSGGTPQRMPTFTDNRLNTGTVLYPNGSPQSEVSLHDNEDYSRPVLRLTNPD